MASPYPALTIRTLARGMLCGSAGSGCPSMPKLRIMFPGSRGNRFVVPTAFTPGAAPTRASS